MASGSGAMALSSSDIKLSSVPGAQRGRLFTFCYQRNSVNSFTKSKKDVHPTIIVQEMDHEGNEANRPKMTEGALR